MKKQIEDKINDMLGNGYSAQTNTVLNQTSDVLKGVFIYAFIAMIIYFVGSTILSFLVDLVVPFPEINEEELQDIIESGDKDEITRFYTDLFSDNSIYISMFLNNIASVIFYPILYSIFVMSYKFDHFKKVTFEDIFVFYKNGKFVNLVLVTLVIQVLSYIGLMLCVLPGVVLYISFILAIPLVIFADANVKEALSYSLKLAFKDFGNFLLFGLILVGIFFLFILFGILMCCVGLFITLPIFYIVLFVMVYLLYKNTVGFPGDNTETEEITKDIYSDNPYMK